MRSFRQAELRTAVDEHPAYLVQGLEDLHSVARACDRRRRRARQGRADDCHALAVGPVISGFPSCRRVRWPSRPEALEACDGYRLALECPGRTRPRTATPAGIRGRTRSAASCRNGCRSRLRRQVALVDVADESGYLMCTGHSPRSAGAAVWAAGGLQGRLLGVVAVAHLSKLGGALLRVCSLTGTRGILLAMHLHLWVSDWSS